MSYSGFMRFSFCFTGLHSGHSGDHNINTKTKHILIRLSKNSLSKVISWFLKSRSSLAPIKITLGSLKVPKKTSKGDSVFR